MRYLVFFLIIIFEFGMIHVCDHEDYRTHLVFELGEAFVILLYESDARQNYASALWLCVFFMGLMHM